MAYDIGDDVLLDCQFLALPARTPTDPSALTVRVKPPVAAEYTLTYGVDAALARLSTGSYRATVDVTEAGTWAFRWKSTGTIAKGAEEGTFQVKATSFTNP